MCTSTRSMGSKANHVATVSLPPPPNSPALHVQLVGTESIELVKSSPVAGWVDECVHVASTKIQTLASLIGDGQDRSIEYCSMMRALESDE
jgi:hypothetical protein